MAIGQISQFVLKHAGQVCSTETDHVIIPHQGLEDVIVQHWEMTQKREVAIPILVRVRNI